MEVRTETDINRSIPDPVFNGDSGAEERLEVLLAVNAEIAREKNLFRDERERLEAAVIIHPVAPDKAYSYFGLMIGALVPAAIFTRLLWDGAELRPENAWVLILLVLTNVTAAVTGFFSGKLISRCVTYLHGLSLGRSLLLLPLLGFVWGMAAGAAGGVFIFVIGAIFGAVLGGLVGAVALPAFALLHRMMKSGEMIDRKYFLPLAFGVTLTICSFILGL